MIEIKDVSFGYSKDRESLHEIDLQVSAGECILLCGVSGCGKTTITKLLNGLIPHFTTNGVLSGTVTVDGMRVESTELYELAKKVGSVFQNPKSQFFNLDSEGELVFGLENQGIPAGTIKQRLTETVASLGINKLVGRGVFTMSGGEKQTLAFASVYAMNPSLYVLDEPSANLDAEAISNLKKQIGLLKDQGHTIVIAEHRLYFLKGLIDKAVYIDKGKIRRCFTAAEFWNLSEEERKKLGLRSITERDCQLPAPVNCGSLEGLSVKGLSCGFSRETPLFSDLSFSAAPGEILGITGVNGAGKTTLTRCLCGLFREFQGQVRMDGTAFKPKQRQKKAFCVMQDVNHQLFSDSVEGECILTDSNVTGEQIDEILERLGLDRYKECHPMTLSGGQKQRLAVATAILSNKQLLIFDEPTSGLDYVCMKEVAQVVKSLRDMGKIVIVVTHDFEFLEEVCDRVLSL